METITYVNEETGEIVESAPSAEISIAGLQTYARKKMRLDLARMECASRAAEVLAADTVYSQWLKTANDLAAECADVEDALGSAFDPKVRQSLGSGIVLDLGFIRITWRKPGKRWSMKKKPEDIAKSDPDLAKWLGIDSKMDKPSAPTVTVKGQLLAADPPAGSATIGA